MAHLYPQSLQASLQVNGVDIKKFQDFIPEKSGKAGVKKISMR